MQKIEFELETVTPVFCSGANKNSAELRPASFKGLFRYWYRAALAEVDAKKLHQSENKIFGSTEEAAKFAVRLKDINQINNNRKNKIRKCPVPHKGNFKIPAIEKGIKFKLILTAKNQKLNERKKIFYLALLLGGVGQRSRRGFGSVKINDKDFTSNSKKSFLLGIAEILKEMNFLETQIKNDQLIVKENQEYSYPVIREIIIGKKDKPEVLLKRIGQATHDCRDRALGNGNPRMSSPVYITINKIANSYYPIITRLEAVYPYRVNNQVGKINKFIEKLR